MLAARTPRVEDARRGELATAAVHGVDALGEYYAKAVPQLALAAVVPPGFVAVVLWHDPVVGGLLALTLPLVVVFMVLVGRASAERIAERRVALGVLGTHFLDVVRGLPTLRAHGRAEAQAETLGAIGERYRLESVAALRVAFLSALVLELLAMVGRRSPRPSSASSSPAARSTSGPACSCSCSPPRSTSRCASPASGTTPPRTARQRQCPCSSCSTPRRAADGEPGEATRDSTRSSCAG